MNDEIKRQFDIDELDQRMEREIHEMNSRRRNKRRKRKIKIYAGRIFAFLIAFALVFTAFATVKKHAERNIIKDKADFVEFTDAMFKEDRVFIEGENSKTKIDYSEDFAVAIKGEKIRDKKISEMRERKIDDILDSCKSKAEDKSDDIFRSILIESAVYKSDAGVYSMAIYWKTYHREDGKMKQDSSGIDTYLVSAENYSHLWPLQVLNVNYKTRASAFANDFIAKTYSSDKLKEGWEQYVTDDDANFNSFIISENSVIFFIKPGTVLHKSEGVFNVTIPKSYMDNSVRPEVLERYIDPNEPMVAITYDDGPGGEYEARILDCLQDNNSVATFFYQGYRLKKFKDTGFSALEIGCEIGNHSWDHPQLNKLSKSEAKKQIEKTNKALKKTYGIDPVMLRPPYGSIDEETAEALGMAEVLWTIDTRDWESRDPKQILKAVKKPKNLDGKIILMHSIYAETAEATEKIIPWLKEQGYQTVTISELIEYKTGKEPKPGTIYREFE